MRLPLPAGKRRARIEIIPLIDIVFFLLATFVMVSLSMVKNQGIAVKLPGAATGAAEERKTHTSVTVTESGVIYFDKERITSAQLPARLAALKRRDGDPQILLNADKQSSFGAVVTVLDETRKLGIKKVSIQTKSKEKEL